MFPTSRFSRLVSADEHIGPQKSNGGTVLRAVGPHGLAAMLCALLGLRRKGGSKGPPQRYCDGSVWWQCKLSKEDFLWPFYLPLRSKAGCCPARVLEWLRKQIQMNCWVCSVFALRMFVNTPENVTWMSMHVVVAVIRKGHVFCSKGTI